MRKVEADGSGEQRHPREGSCGKQSLLCVSRLNAKQTDRFPSWLKGRQHSPTACVSFPRLNCKSAPPYWQGQHFIRCLFIQLLPGIHWREAPIDIANCQWWLTWTIIAAISFIDVLRLDLLCIWLNWSFLPRKQVCLSTWLAQEWEIYYILFLSTAWHHPLMFMVEGASCVCKKMLWFWRLCVFVFTTHWVWWELPVCTVARGHPLHPPTSGHALKKIVSAHPPAIHFF